jgi:hypothetical protein
MITERPDLNGARLVVSGASEVWLVFHGRRHLAPTAEVISRLFRSTDLTVVAGVDDIARGPDLHPDALLIRDGETGALYLLTAAYEGGVRKHLIPGEPDLALFDFDPAQALVLPTLVVSALPAGRDIAAPES